MEASLFLLALAFTTGRAEIWQQEVGKEMNIGASDTGYKRVDLRCGADYMQVDIETEEDFEGVIYTRGSFYDQNDPCYVDAKEGQKFTLRFPFTKCHTKKHDENLYSNVIVIQHDDELIMPGDAAFTVECDFKQPRDVTATADLQSSRTVESRISLADADPAGKELPRHRRSTVSNSSDSVHFTPSDIRPRRKKKDEL